MDERASPCRLSHDKGLKPLSSPKVGSEGAPTGEELGLDPKGISDGTDLELVNRLDFGSGDLSAGQSLGTAPDDVLHAQGFVVPEGLLTARILTKVVLVRDRLPWFQGIPAVIHPPYHMED